MKTFFVFSILTLLFCLPGSFFSLSQAQENDQKKSYKICFIGDAGISSSLSSQKQKALQKNQEKVARKMEQEGCHRIHYLGDLIYPRGLSSPSDPDFCQQFFHPYQDLLKKVPFHIALGNHDHISRPEAWLQIGTATPQTKFPELFPKPPSYLKVPETQDGAEPLLPHPSIVFPGFFYEEIHGKDSPLPGLCIVTLDSTSFVPEKEFLQKTLLRAKPGKSDLSHHYRTMRNHQRKWLQEFNKNDKDCKIKIALAHHPFKSTGKHGPANSSLLKHRYEKFLKKHIIGEFDYLITGHDHVLSFEGTFSGQSGRRPTQVMVSGAGAEASRPHGKRYKSLQKKVSQGQDLFARQTLGFISLTLPPEGMEQAELKIHYSDEEQEEWNLWSPRR